ncbi:MAG: hypothetical protein ACYTEZ_19900 [Planctomycetota bacterium]|jgi:hypothetical protein
MFLLNLGHRWSLTGALEEHQGVVYLASGNNRERLRRKSLPEFRKVLFDPQLYLAGLDATECQVACARLATHGHFGVEGTPDFDSGQGLQKWHQELCAQVGALWPGTEPSDGAAIKAACLDAIESQAEIPCSHIILPTPLVAEREDEAVSLAEWLDAGIEAATEMDIGQDLLASIAVSEAILNEIVFEDAGLLDTIVDHVTARAEIGGGYVVIVQTESRHPFKTPDIVLRAYLHLCKGLSAARLDTVLVNFAGVFGICCVAAGATGFCAGGSYAQRRLALPAFKPTKGGVALPHFYSHRTAAEYLSESDLAHVVARNQLRRIRDTTPFSRDLMRALEKGESASNLPNWAESQNNLAQSHKHFVNRLLREERRLDQLPVRDRQDAVLDWLDSAGGSADAVKRRLKGLRHKIAFARVATWGDLLLE